MSEYKQENYRDTYRTGRTDPPKSHQGVIAILLILVTVLSSIVTVLGMMNVRMWSILQDREKQDGELENQIALAEMFDEAATEEETVLGMSCQEISELYRSYNQWPSGLYISQVEPGSPADRCKILSGDILIAVNGTPVSRQAEWKQAVDTAQPGTQLKLTIYRDEKQINIMLTKD